MTAKTAPGEIWSRSGSPSSGSLPQFYVSPGVAYVYRTEQAGGKQPVLLATLVRGGSNNGVQPLKRLIAYDKERHVDEADRPPAVHRDETCSHTPHLGIAAPPEENVRGGGIEDQPHGAFGRIHGVEQHPACDARELDLLAWCTG
jgi:hypothetical protein